jgi:cytochrome P450
MGMVLQPEVQKKAQACIDAVVGLDRLPDLPDKGSIPYVDAIMLETLRYYPVAPLGLFMHLVDARLLLTQLFQEYHTPQALTTSTTDTSFRRAQL